MIDKSDKQFNKNARLFAVAVITFFSFLCVVLTATEKESFRDNLFDHLFVLGLATATITSTVAFLWKGHENMFPPGAPLSFAYLAFGKEYFVNARINKLNPTDDQPANTTCLILDGVCYETEQGPLGSEIQVGKTVMITNCRDNITIDQQKRGVVPLVIINQDAQAELQIDPETALLNAERLAYADKFLRP